MRLFRLPAALPAFDPVIPAIGYVAYGFGDRILASERERRALKHEQQQLKLEQSQLQADLEEEEGRRAQLESELQPYRDLQARRRAILQNVWDNMDS